MGNLINPRHSNIRIQECTVKKYLMQFYQHLLNLNEYKLEIPIYVPGASKKINLSKYLNSKIHFRFLVLCPLDEPDIWFILVQPRCRLPGSHRDPERSSSSQ